MTQPTVSKVHSDCFIEGRLQAVGVDVGRPVRSVAIVATMLALSSASMCPLCLLICTPSPGLFQ